MGSTVSSLKAAILLQAMEQQLRKHNIENKLVSLLYCILLRYTNHEREIKLRQGQE
jgi:hypothetical protein